MLDLLLNTSKQWRGHERLLKTLIYQELQEPRPDPAQVEFLRQIMMDLREDINRLETEIQGEIYE